MANVRFVKVKHPDCEKEFIFGVPDNLIPFVRPGVGCECNTWKGIAPGTIVTECEELPPKEFKKRHPYSYYPPSNIKSINISVQPEDVRLPNYISPPNPKKLIKRLEEFSQEGKFKTRIIFTPDLVLKDGYTAYLVCKLYRIPVCGKVRDWNNRVKREAGIKRSREALK